MTPHHTTRCTTDDRGAAMVIFSLMLFLSLALAALVVDLGFVRSESAEVQGDADLIALDGVRVLDGRTVTEVEPDVVTATNASAARNEINGSFTIEYGYYSDFDCDGVDDEVGDPEDADDNKEYCVIDPADYDTDVPNALTIHLTRLIDYRFRPGDQTVTRSGTSIKEVFAGGEIGSVFAGFQLYQEPGASATFNANMEFQAEVLNATLGFFFNTTASTGATVPTGLGLDAVSYKGLASADVLLGDLAGQMGFASTTDLLTSSVSAADLMTATANALNAQGDAASADAATIIGSFASDIDSSLNLTLGNYVKVAQGAGAQAASMQLNVLNLIQSMAYIIDGRNFANIEINVLNVPGVVTAPLKISVIEPPQAFFGPVGRTDFSARTAQVHISTEQEAPVVINLGVINALLGQDTFTATVPFEFEIGSAEGYASDAQCQAPNTDQSVDMTVTSSGLGGHIGAVTDGQLQNESGFTADFQSLIDFNASILGVGVDLTSRTRVRESQTIRNSVVNQGAFSANTSVAGATETFTFMGPFPPHPSGTVPDAHRFDGGTNIDVAASLINGLEFESAGNSFQNELKNALLATLSQTTPNFIDPLLSALGVTLAGADGVINYLDCNTPLLYE